MTPRTERERIARVVEKVLNKFGMSTPHWQTATTNKFNMALSAITKNELAKERARVRRIAKAQRVIRDPWIDRDKLLAALRGRKG